MDAANKTQAKMIETIRQHGYVTTESAGVQTMTIDTAATATQTITATAAEYLAHKSYPQAAALGVALEVVAPGRYRVQPQDSYDGAGNRHYALIDDMDGGHYAFSGLTYGQALVWIGERADDRSSEEDRPAAPRYTYPNGAPTAHCAG